MIDTAWTSAPISTPAGETPADIQQPTHTLMSTLADIVARVGEPLSVTVTGRIHTVYIHTSRLDQFEAWCRELDVAQAGDGTDDLVGSWRVALAYLGGWTVLVQVMGCVLDVEAVA